MGSMRSLLLLVMTVLLVHKGESLKCWYCDTMHLRGCSDPFLASADVQEDLLFTKDCESKLYNHIQILPNGTTDTEIVNPGLGFVCIKLVGKIFGEKHVFRNCVLGLPNITQGSCVSSILGSRIHQRIGGTIEECEACVGDLCNGAVVVGTNAVLLAPLLLLLK
ncbi:uncharacterized protein LOC133526525 [Cydia pomonella]|uniref:uncharacterized protein LOC133526525 n=1 Tax=Cydia pomonella TaxID=82600 RepID=UPI002ADD93F0|nr:uncharacterized protein LOC133526525 [Cydia pomonella]